MKEILDQVMDKFAFMGVLKAVRGSDRRSDKSKNFEFSVAVRILYVSAHIKPVGDNIFKFSF